MRLSSVFFASVGVLLLATEVVTATTTAEQSQVSTITSPEPVLLITQNNEPEKRFLRSHHPSKENEEERLRADKIDLLMSGGSYRTTKFNKWIRKNFTDRKIHDKFNVDSNPMYRRIVNEYQNHLSAYGKQNLLTMT